MGPTTPEGLWLVPALLFLDTWRWWEPHTAHPPLCERPVEAFQTTFPEQVSPFLHPDTFPPKTHILG